MSAQKAPEATRESIEDYIARVVALAPPLTEDQKAQIRPLLRQVRRVQ